MPTANTSRRPLAGSVAVALAVVTALAVAAVAAVDLLDLNWVAVAGIIAHVGDAFRAASVALALGVTATTGPALLAERRGGRERTLALLAGVVVAAAVAAWVAVAAAAARRDTPGERERRQEWERVQAGEAGERR